MKKFILHIFDWFSAHRLIAALILGSVLLLCALSALRLDFQEDISAFLPSQQQEQLSQSGAQEKLAVFFTAEDQDAVLDAMDCFQLLWEESCPDIPIELEADNSRVKAVFDFLGANWPYFLEEGDYARADSLLAGPSYVQEQLQRDKISLYGTNPMLARYIRTDPLNLFSPVLKRLQQAQAQSLLVDGRLFTPDGKTGIAFIDSPYGGSESARNAALVAVLAQVKQQTAEEYPLVQLRSTGGPEVAAENASRIKKDSLLALLLSSILILLVLWFSYKRLADVLWILVSILSGALFALGLIALFKTSISIIVLGIGCTVIGIAVNYPLHYVDHLKYQPDKRRALAEQITPLLVGNITTVGAFLGLMLMKAEALHDFGFIGAMMLVGTIIFVLLFLPVFVPAAKAPRRAIKLDVDRFLHPSREGRRWIFVLFLLLTALLWWGSGKVRFESDLHGINYMTAEQESGFAILEGMRANSSAFPLPDTELQQDRIRQWDAFWARHASLSDQLISEGLSAGFTAHAFQPFFDVLDHNWEPQPRSYFQPVDFAPESSAASSLVDSLQEDFSTIGLVCSLIVFVFLMLSFGSLELTLVSFLPLMVSWIWIQGIMGLCGLHFNIVNIILATFIFGMGDDYSIFITEGLLYERATGKKILHSYKNAVMLSGLIMFIGIGVLALAKHPAMRSLGLVTVIGMLTVVAMAYYLPPLLFRVLTARHGEERKAPLTLGSLLRTVFITLMMVLWMTFLSLLTLFIPGGTFFHKLLQRVASWAVRLIPGCPYTLYNPHGETFSTPAVYVCNHQSHLDVLAVLALQHKVIFMTNDWVWRFPFYGMVLRKAGCFPSSWGLAKNREHVRKMVAQGYSIVIFPEGTRTPDGHIQRFHRGAFLTARELDLDVLPLCIHGFHYALPKHDFLLRKAGLSMEVGERIHIPQDEDISVFTRQMRHFYNNWYADIRRRRETAAYVAPLVRLQYLYKGEDSRRECREVLRSEVYARVDALSGEKLSIPEAGCGVYALLVALAHPNMQIEAYVAEQDQYLTAQRANCSPENLKYLIR